MARKPRKDGLEAWLARRPELREELLHGLYSGALGNDEAAAKLAKAGKKISPQAVSTWARRWGLACKIDDAKDTARVAASALPADADATFRRAFEGAIFAIKMRRDLTPEQAAAFERNEISRRSVAVQERRVSVMERREATAKEVLGDEDLSDEQKTARMKQVFGLA